VAKNSIGGRFAVSVICLMRLGTEASIQVFTLADNDHTRQSLCSLVDDWLPLKFDISLTLIAQGKVRHVQSLITRVAESLALRVLSPDCRG
jgi:hypothetical protein